MVSVEFRFVIKGYVVNYSSIKFMISLVFGP